MRLSESLPLLAMLRRQSSERIIPPLAGVAVVAVLVLVTPGGWQRSLPASAASGGPEIIPGSGGFCNSSGCYAEAGATFTVGVNVVTAPATGYIAVQTYIDFRDYDPGETEDGTQPATCSDSVDNGSQDGADILDTDYLRPALVYLPRADAGQEFMDDDFTAAARNDGLEGRVAHAGLTALLPPVPTTVFEGRLLELDLRCPGGPVITVATLLPHGNLIAEALGAVFMEPDLETVVVPKLNSITVSCVTPQAHPGDTDGDGCSDLDENGTDPTQGGDRDSLSPWDFYDVAGAGGGAPDGVIDLFNDVVGVVEQVGTAPGPPYDVQYDRGPWAGASSWNDTGPPDGVIDSATDVNGVLAQNGHNCT